MCGIVGGAGLELEKDYEIFKTLFLANATRGEDSSGLFYTYEEKKPSKKMGCYFNSKKSLMASPQLIYTKTFADIIDLKPGCIVGHSRAATKGNVTEKNAHPFEIKKEGLVNIVGVHNGTIVGSFQDSNKFETDSEALFALISKLGLKEALDNIHKESSNVAYALVFYDNKEGKVNIVRNAQRPLSIAINKRSPKMFWSSTNLILMFGLSSNGVANDYEIINIDSNTLIQFNPFEKITEENIVVTKDWYTPPVSDKSFYKQGENYYSIWGENITYKREKNAFTPPTTKVVPYVPQTLLKNQNKFNSKDSSSPNLFKINGQCVTKKELLKTLSNGCMVCGNPSTIINNNWENMRFEKDKITDFVCEDCTDKHDDNMLACEYGLYNLVKAQTWK